MTSSISLLTWRKTAHLLLICTLSLGRIHETVMDASPCLAGPHGTFLRSRIANGHNQIKIFCMQFIDIFRFT